MSAYAAAPVCTPRAALRHRTLSAAARGRLEKHPQAGVAPNTACRRRSDGGVAAEGQRLRQLARRQMAYRGGSRSLVRIATAVDEFVRHPEWQRRLLHPSSLGRPGAPPAQGPPDLWENLKPIERVGYMTDLLSTTKPRGHRTSAPKPFFLSLQYTAPHSRWRPEDEAIGHTTHGGGSMTKADRGRSTVHDEEDGRWHRPRAQGAGTREARARQLVIFTSDNGGER